MNITPSRRRFAVVGATALLISAPLSALGALSASAHDQAFDVTCTSISVNLTNYPAGSTIGGTLDGADVGTTTFGPSFQQSAPLDPAVAHSWDIRVVSGDGDHRYDRTFAGVSDPACIPVVEEPETPVVTPPAPTPVVEPRIQDYVTCLGGAFVLDNTGSTEAVLYTVQGEAILVPAGEAVHTDLDGTLFQPLDGTYTVTAGETTWTFQSAGNCPTDQPTEPTPAPEPTPTPSDEPSSPTPTLPASPESTPGPSALPMPGTNSPSPSPSRPSPVVSVEDNTTPPAAAPESLAFTGSQDTTAWVALGAVLLAAGAVAVIVPRARRRAARNQS